MANSSSTKKSLRSLFSKSEVDLKEPSEKDESRSRSRTLKLFRWKKKRQAEGDGAVTSRVDSPEADEEDWPDGDQKPTIYATAPRSKKKLISSSETDLHKPKRFSTFSLGWRKKKKKNVSFSQSTANISGEVTDHVGEAQIQDQVDRAEFSQPVQHEIVEPQLSPNLVLTDPPHHQNVCNEETTEGAAGFMPANIDSTLISYIDSDGDGYHTPPESPGLLPEVFVYAYTDPDSTGQAPAELSSTYSTLNPDTNTETTNIATPGILNASTNFTRSTTPDVTEPVPSSEIPAPGSGDSSPVCLHAQVSEPTSAAPTITSSTSTVCPYSTSLTKGRDISSAAGKGDLSLTPQNSGEQEWYISEHPVEAVTTVNPEVPSQGLFTPGSPHSSPTSSVPKPTEQTASQISYTTDVPSDVSSKTEHSNTDNASGLPATPDRKIPTPEHSPNSKQDSADHNHWVSPSSCDVTGDSLQTSGSTLKHPHTPVLPGIILSSTELSSSSHDPRDLEGVSASVDASLTSTHDSLHPILAAVQPVYHELRDESVPSPLGTETSLRPSTTVGTDPNDDFSDPPSRYTYMESLDHSGQGTELTDQATPEPVLWSLETVTKVSPNTDSGGPLAIYPDISYHSHSSGIQLQEEHMDANSSLEAAGCSGQGTELTDQATPEPELWNLETVTKVSPTTDSGGPLAIYPDISYHSHSSGIQLQEVYVDANSSLEAAGCSGQGTELTDQATPEPELWSLETVTKVSSNSDSGGPLAIYPDISYHSHSSGIQLQEEHMDANSSLEAAGCSGQGTELTDQATPEPVLWSLETVTKVSPNTDSGGPLAIYPDISYHSHSSGIQLQEVYVDANSSLEAAGCSGQGTELTDQATPEPELWSLETVTKVSPTTDSGGPLAIYPDISYHSHSSGIQLQEEHMDANSSLEAAGCSGQGTELTDQATPEPVLWSLETVTKVSPNTDSGGPLAIYPDISYHSHSSGIQLQEVYVDANSSLEAAGCSGQGTELTDQATPEPELWSLETVTKVSPNTDSGGPLAIDPDISYHSHSSGIQLQEVYADANSSLEAAGREEPPISFQEHGGYQPVTRADDFESYNQRSPLENLVKVVSDERDVQLVSAGGEKVEEHTTSQKGWMERVKCEAEEVSSCYISERGMDDQETQAHQFPEAQDLSGRESEVLAGAVAQQLSDLAITKPDVPVQRERVPEECKVAPPWSLHGEVSITDYSPATYSYLGAGYSPSLTMLSGSVIKPQEDTAGGVASLHAEREDSSIQEQVTLTEASTTSREDTYTHLTCTGEEELSKTRHSQEEEISTPEAEDSQGTYYNATVTSRSAFSADTQHQLSLQAVNSTTDTSRTVTDRGAGVIVYVREFGLENEIEDHPTGTSALPDQPPAPSYTSAGRFSHAFPALSTVAEESDPESPVDSASGSDTEMNSGIGVLSTTLTLRPKSSEEGREDGKRVRKVSLVNNSSSSTSRSVHYLGEDRLTDMNGASHEPDGVRNAQEFGSVREESKPSTVDASYSELSGNTYLYSSLSSSRYEPTTYSSYSYSFSSDAPPSSVSMDTTSSLGNSSWWNLRSEVQDRNENELNGRRWEELSAPAGAREVEREGGITNTGSDSLTQQQDDYFSGVFKATRVELPSSPTDADPEPAPAPEPAPEPSMPASPHEMDTLLDTLKSMGPPVRHRSLRNSSTQPFSSLPPIVEDAPVHVPSPISSPTSPGPREAFSSLPPDLGLNWSSMKDMRSPLAMMKEQKGSEPPTRSLVLPSRASAISSIVMRKSSLPDLNLEDGSQVNGGSSFGMSRLDHSLIFSSYRSETEENGKGLGHRSLFRTASLPEVSSGLDRLSMPPKATDTLGSGTSRLERLSFLTSPPGSLKELKEPFRISVSPSFLNSSTTESPTLNHTPPQNLEIYRTLSPESPVKHPTPPSLQRSLSAEGLSIGSPVFNEGLRGYGGAQEPAPERSFVAKYRAFPDAYLTKEKEHGKLNPRPGKMLIYDQPGLCGQRIEVRGDVIDATAWQLPRTISIRVIRGGWVLYEKPDFKGEKIALDEGDIELSDPFSPAEDESNPVPNGTQEPGEEHAEPKPERRFVIGSLRRAVRDYSVPEICLFPEENAEGKKIVFRDTSEDSRIFGFPIKANSIIINAGLWLVFAEPFFQGAPRVLEVGGFPNPAAWGVTQPYVSSLHPLKIGEPRVEKPNEPKLVIYEKPYFTGKSREIYTNTRDFMTREERQQAAFMYNAGSIKVLGGIWVGYEKEGFRGHQYLLEEGEYHDWRVWGGCDSELRSVRVIRTDLSQPMLVMFEMQNEEQEAQEERTFEVTEAVPDVEPFGFRPATRSIHVLSGAWVAYSHVDYSGKQYVLEKGFYNNCADWGSEDNRICSIQPILQVQAEGPSFRSELLLYIEPAFQGVCQVYTRSHEALPEKLSIKSCRVIGESWVLYSSTNFQGEQYVLSEGDYCNFSSMGCPPDCSIRSVKSVPMIFSVPSISLFGLECFEGREVTMESEVSNMMEEGYNPHILSVRVNSGCWVLCEHTNYRGRQFLLEPIEITNWHKFSSLSSVSSMYPIRAKRRLFRIRYKETGHYMSVQGGVDNLKSGRVVVSNQVEGMSDIWFYQDGLIKNKLAQNMSLQVMGNVEPGAKVVLWSETRSPVQTWSAQLSGTISSLTFPGLLLDVKGGKTYDKEHVIVRIDTEENSGLWELELL